MRNLICAAVCASIAIAARAELRELSFTTAMPVDEAPVIDGRLDEAAWGKGVPHRNYFKYLDPKGEHFTNFVTTCTIVYDEKGVYTGVVNYDPYISELKRNVLKDNDPVMWRDDCAELYYDPAATGVGFYKFVVNANGKNDACWRMDAANIHEDWRAPGVVSAAQVFDDRWEFEIFVPWEAYGLKGRPDAGTVWTFNHSRFAWAKWKLCSSAPCAGGTQPQRFGTLYFSDGTAPSPERILAQLDARNQPDWGIQIGDRTYLRTLAGTEEISEDLPTLIARKEAEAKAEEELCKTNIVRVCTTAEPVPVLKLDLAGTYDTNPPKEYDGYNGWYRHNVDKSVVGGHLPWADRLANRPRVLFVCDMRGEQRDIVEFAARFNVDADVIPGRWDLTGIWEDCVKGGTPLEKSRQFETLLARNPDVVVVTNGRIWSDIPARYKLELLRRVRDEGLGLVLADWQAQKVLDTISPRGTPRDPALRDYLALVSPFAEIPGFSTPPSDGRQNWVDKALVSVTLGKGRVIQTNTLNSRWKLDNPDWINGWAAAQESRYAHYFNLIRCAQKGEPNVTFAIARLGEDRCVVDERSVFYPFTVNVREVGLLSKGELRLRLRDSANRIVREETRPLTAGENVFAYPVRDLSTGDYTLDLIASVGGAVESVAFRPFTVRGAVGSFGIDTNRTNVMDRVVRRDMNVRAMWETRLPEPLVCRFTLKTLPYRETVWTQEVAVAARQAASPMVRLVNDRFPTLAAVLESELATTNGVRLAGSARTFFFPNSDYDPYTMIMWDSLSCGGANLVPQLAEITTGEFGYRNHLGESGFTSALFNSRAVPYIAHISLQPADNGGVTWGTWGHLFGHGKESQECLAQFEGDKKKETNPYDPRVLAAFERFFAPKAQKAAPFGACVWNLGDENGFSYEAGNGPQDAEPYVKFLKEKYGTVEKYNKVHGTNIADFAAAPHLVKAQAVAARDWPAYYDHVQYMDRLYSDTYQSLAKIVKRYDPKARVGAEGSTPGELEQTVAKLEFWGPYRNLVSDELLRNLDPNKVRGTWWGGYFDNLRDGFPVQQWEYVLTGTLNADQWFQLGPGSSQGALGGDFKFAPYVAKMLPHLKRIRRGMAHSFQATPFRDERFAIYYSYASEHAAKIDDAYPPADGIPALIRYCYRQGFGVKMITARTIRKLEGVKVLFLSGASALSDAEVASLKTWVKKGGLLLSDCEPGVLDGFLASRGEPPLKGLWTAYRWDAPDAEISAILAKKGIVNKESISGLPASSCVFRVREREGLRLVGFKCVKKDLGSHVTIDLGEAGTVYEMDSGRCLGRLSKIDIPALDIPFKCYAVYAEEPSVPTPETLVPGRVYRLSAFDPKGREIEHRARIFTAAKGVDPMKDFFIPLDEPAGTTYRLRDVNSGLEGEVVKRSR